MLTGSKKGTDVYDTEKEVITFKMFMENKEQLKLFFPTGGKEDT